MRVNFVIKVQLEMWAFFVLFLCAKEKVETQEIANYFLRL